MVGNAPGMAGRGWAGRRRAVEIIAFYAAGGLVWVPAFGGMTGSALYEAGDLVLDSCFFGNGGIPFRHDCGDLDSGECGKKGNPFRDVG